MGLQRRPNPGTAISILFMSFLFLFPTCITSTSSVVSHGSVNGEVLDLECLKVPSSVFLSSLITTIKEVQNVASLVAKFVSAFDNDFRLSNAINDCLDLLDFSADELSLTVSATQNPNGKDNSTGNRRSDLKTWLSAALGNQDTCIDGFDGTDNSFVKTIVGGSLGQVTSLVAQVLGMVDGGHTTSTTATTTNTFSTKSRSKSSSSSFGTSDVGAIHHHKHHFPTWMQKKDRKLLLQQQSGRGGINSGNETIYTTTADVVVALDGSGNYTSVMDAVLAAPNYSTRRYVVYIKRGVYKENVEIKKKKWNLMMIGDGMNKTIISGNRSFIDGWTTFRSATFAVAGKGFMARDITFENTAGPAKHQAVALRSDSDLSVFFRCGIHGYQDTLYAHSLRQFYRECRISGTVDFIFGNGAVVFQNCEILVRKGLPDQKNTITAQGRKDPNQNTGFSIQFSNISWAPDDSYIFNTTATNTTTNATTNGNTTATFLGRPWKEYSKTIFMETYMSNIIRPEGWLAWQGDFALDTLYYGEYRNYGPGAGLGNRVKWPGFHPMNNSAQVMNFTVAQFIDGKLWLPSTGVKFTAGLTN